MGTSHCGFACHETWLICRGMPPPSRPLQQHKTGRPHASHLLLIFGGERPCSKLQDLGGGQAGLIGGGGRLQASRAVYLLIVVDAFIWHGLQEHTTLCMQGSGGGSCKVKMRDSDDKNGDTTLRTMCCMQPVPFSLDIAQPIMHAPSVPSSVDRVCLSWMCSHATPHLFRVHHLLPVLRPTPPAHARAQGLAAAAVVDRRGGRCSPPALGSHAIGRCQARSACMSVAGGTWAQSVGGQVA